MVRKAVWKPKAAATTRSAGIKDSELASKRHRHGCTTCSHTYEDRCDDPLVNGLCTACRDVPYDPPVWELSLAPQECCTNARKVVLPAERMTYLLGGDAEWWICPKCYRPFIYKPGANIKKKEMGNDRIAG